MAKKGCREFHIQNEEILQLVMADNSDGEDDLQLDEEDQQVIAQDVENGTDVVEIEDSVQEPTNQTSLPTCSDTLETIPVLNWRNNSYAPYTFNESEYDFGGINTLSDRHGMLLPMDIFMEVTQMNQLVSNIIIKESVKYAQQNGRTFYSHTDNTLQNIYNIYFVMCYHVLPTLRNYRSTDEDMGVPFIANVIQRIRFEQIRQNLHFSENNNHSQSSDRAYKIRSVMQHFNLCFQAAVNNSLTQSIDEHMIKFKGHNILKQYINKRIIWGFKMWCRCESSTGYLYQFDLYTGKKISLSESLVLCLTEQLKGCEVYFEDFFNPPALQHKLMMQNTKACGTVRTNRKNVPKSLPSDKSMRTGDIYAVSTNGITFVKWMDTKAVHMLTNFISPVPTSTVKRRQAGTAQKINVTCPEIVI